MGSANISYRLATSSDLAALQLRQQQRESNYPGSELIERWVKSQEFWLAEDGSNIVGWMSLQDTFFEEGFVSILWVEPEYRRQGIGSVLMQSARDICKTDRLWTSTNESNQPMRALMSSRGWEFSGSIKHLDPEDPELIYCNVKRT